MPSSPPEHAAERVIERRDGSEKGRTKRAETKVEIEEKRSGNVGRPSSTALKENLFASNALFFRY